MHAVGDEPERDPAVREQGSGQSWFPMVKRRHGVEEVRAEADAGVKPAVRLGQRRAGMARGHGHTGGGQLSNGSERARQLGRERDHGGRQLQQRADFFELG